MNLLDLVKGIALIYFGRKLCVNACIMSIVGSFVKEIRIKKKVESKY
jgi:hypothetical protein